MRVPDWASPLAQPLRDAKHRHHRWWWWAKLRHKTKAINAYRALRPYRYDADRHYNTFLAMEPPADPQPQQRAVPRTIWVAWTGDNDMSPARQRGLASIRELNPQADVVLITPDNLQDHVIDGVPLHPIYEHLSYVHRSDYLRCYLLHHHGGAYTDIKPQRAPLTEAIDLLNSNTHWWLVGGTQPGLAAALDHETPLEREARRNFSLLPTGAAFAVRAHTPFTNEWFAELTRRCDYYFDGARRHPGGVWGLWHPNVHQTKYPIHWNELQANIFEPLSLKYSDHLHLEDRFRPELVDYR